MKAPTFALVGAVLTLSACSSVGPDLTGAFDEQERWLQYESELKARMSASASLAELEEAGGPLGVVLPRDDGSWIAIGYQDTHIFPGSSCAVALTSSGTWLTSTYHFCGEFKFYRLYRQSSREDPELKKFELFRVDSASSLDEAIQHLLEYHFVKSSGPDLTEALRTQANQPADPTSLVRPAIDGPAAFFSLVGPVALGGA